jgi:hypothetical protein
MKKKRQEESKEGGRRRRKEGEREKKEKGREIVRCFCFWPEDRNVQRRPGKCAEEGSCPGMCELHVNIS